MTRFSADFEPHLVSFGPRAELDRIETYSLDRGRWLFRRWYGRRMFQGLIRRIKPALIHFHMARPRFLQGVLPDDIPLIASTMGADIMPDQNYVGADKAGTDWLLGRAVRVTAKSPFMVARLIEMGFGAKTVQINWGVDDVFPLDQAEAERRTAALGIDPARPFLFSCRSINRIYDSLTVVRAFGRLTESRPEVDLVMTEGFIGSAYGREVRAEIDRAGLTGRVRIMPRLSQTDLAALLGTCRAAISVPLSDGLSQTFMEARVSGTVMIMTDLDQYTGLISPGRDALTVPRQDPAALALAMDRALTDDDLPAAARAAAGPAGRRYDQKSQTELMRAIYDEALSR